MPTNSNGASFCFVIMPFREDLDPVLAAVREAVDRAGEGLGCIRLDDLRHAGRITDDLTRALENAQVCVADLSGLNPNVMWEIGFAMSREKPMIFVSQEIDNLPFDVSNFRVIRYDLATVRRSLAPELALALKETSAIYRWHARPTVASTPRFGLRALRFALAIALLAGLAAAAFLWSIERSLGQAQASLTDARASLRVCTPTRYIYHYPGNNRICDGFFEKKGVGSWEERTPAVPGCVPTTYHFKEIGQEDGWTILSDASRGYFIRLPLKGDGTAQLAPSRGGPWGGLHEVERADIP